MTLSVGGDAANTQPLTPSDLLIALHHMDVSPTEMKAVIAGKCTITEVSVVFWMGWILCVTVLYVMYNTDTFIRCSHKFAVYGATDLYSRGVSWCDSTAY